jgi:DNA-nicking Smr family endonuclease
MTAKKGNNNGKGGSKAPPLTDEDKYLWRYVSNQVTPIQSNRHTGFEELLKPGAAAGKPSVYSVPVQKKKIKPDPFQGLNAASQPAPITGNIGRGADTTPSVRQNVAGLDRNTSEKLRKGKMSIDGRVDLHGMTQREAHSRLRSFLGHAHRKGWRCVLVITGKGSSVEKTDDAPFMGTGRKGVLREEVPRWLAEPSLRRLVLDYRTAQLRHGGSGALYVLLKRSRGIPSGG